jgi:integrase
VTPISSAQDKWRKEVEAVSLHEVTAERIQDWKKEFLAKAGKGVVAQRRAKVSVNSILRQARSLFSPNLLRQLKLSLPEPLPFSGVEFESRQTMKYQSKIDVVELMQLARKELEEAAPESYKIFLLAVNVGLRRKEIDLLEWSSFRWDNCLIRIQATEWFHPKSEESLADLPVEPEVMELFRRYHTRGSGRFVIRCRRPPQPRRSQQYYRCAPHFDKLIEWLRDHGVDGNKPLHALRKEYGSLITQAHGIYAASRALRHTRHTDLRTTSEHYVDSRSRATPGLGRLLAAQS